MKIQYTRNLDGAAAGTCLSSLMQNIPQLRRLYCSWNGLRLDEGVRAMCPTLQVNRTLRELSLFECDIGDEGICLLVDALVGNTTLKALYITWDNRITPAVAIACLTRLIESTRLQTIRLWPNRRVFFNDADATQHFVKTLQHKYCSLQELLGIDARDFPGDEDSQIATFSSINNSLTRNRQLNRVNLLLTQQQQQQRNAAAISVMLKISHKGNRQVCRDSQQRGGQCHFQTFPSATDTVRKASPSTNCRRCCCCCLAGTRTKASSALVTLLAVLYEERLQHQQQQQHYLINVCWSCRYNAAVRVDATQNDYLVRKFALFSDN
jgi:Leucine Rich repeat